MKIVITGALGHIGSRLIRSLPDSFPDVEIVMMDDLSTQRYCSLFNLPAHGKYRFLEADVMTADLDAILRGSSVVVHLAAISNAAGSFQIRERVEQVNVEGTARVAHACVRAGAPLIFPSTTSVYGKQSGVVDEDCPAEDLKPQSPYAEAKLRAEKLLGSMAQEQGLRFITCRFGTIFGVSPGMRFHTAINKFCWQAVTGQPLTVWRTAMDQYRPYLDLTDAINALTMIMQKELYDGRIYNVVTANTSVRTVAEILSLLVPDLFIEYVDAEIMNHLSYHVDNRRFRDAGFESRGDLAHGIRETIELLQAASSLRSGVTE